MEQFRVGVIGCGAISGNHFHAIRKAEQAVLRAVCDIDEERLLCYNKTCLRLCILA